SGAWRSPSTTPGAPTTWSPPTKLYASPWRGSEFSPRVRSPTTAARWLWVPHSGSAVLEVLRPPRRAIEGAKHARIRRDRRRVERRGANACAGVPRGLQAAQAFGEQRARQSATAEFRMRAHRFEDPDPRALVGPADAVRDQRAIGGRDDEIERRSIGRRIPHALIDR